jgi:uncharacterized LabA/DUF88 family protein
MKNKDQRVGIFIDIQNLYHSAKNLYNARVNYKELLKTLVGGRKLIRAIAYVVKADAETSPSISGEAAFFDALKRTGIELRVKDIQIYASGMKKADWDVGMAVDAIRMADFLDVVILLTGDGDFIPLIEYLRLGRGREVEVAAFSRSANGKMKEVVDEFISIEDVPRSLTRIGNIRRAGEKEGGVAPEEVTEEEKHGIE